MNRKRWRRQAAKYRKANRAIAWINDRLQADLLKLLKSSTKVPYCDSEYFPPVATVVTTRNEIKADMLTRKLNDLCEDFGAT